MGYYLYYLDFFGSIGIWDLGFVWDGYSKLIIKEL
jgi:hypothetical protein